MLTTLLRCAGLSLALMSSAGCWSYRASTAPRTVARAEGVDASTWPTRDVEPLKAILENTPAEFASFELVEGATEESLTVEERALAAAPRRTVVYKGIHGKCLLRIFDFEERPRIAAAETEAQRRANIFGPGFAANGRILTSRTLTAGAEQRANRARLAVPEPQRPPLAWRLPVMHLPIPAPRLRMGSREGDIHLQSGKPIRIPPAREPGGYKGLILHFQAIAYNEYEPKVLLEFERRGWAVIDIATESSTVPPLDEESVRRYKEAKAKANVVLEQLYAAQDAEFRNMPQPAHTDVQGQLDWLARYNRFATGHPLFARYTNLNKAAEKLLEASFQACAGADLDAVARQIAERADQAIAGNAYAAEACLDYVRTQRPDLQDVPVVLMGFSAGALTGPTAGALLRDHLDAVVLIGGAVNVFQVAQESSFTDGGLTVRCEGRRVGKDVIAELNEGYLRHSRLDPYHTAPLIAHLPILQVHATFDSWVPARLGDELHARLGRPDRLKISAGHELLFYFLPGKARFIADWVERATGMNEGKR